MLTARKSSNKTSNKRSSLVHLNNDKANDDLKSLDDEITEIIKEEMKKEPTPELPKRRIIRKFGETDFMLENKLKRYRRKKATDEGVNAYMIFTNAMLDDLLEKLPKTKEDLLKIEGFSEEKVEKYGDGILKLIRNS